MYIYIYIIHTKFYKDTKWFLTSEVMREQKGLKLNSKLFGLQGAVFSHKLPQTHSRANSQFPRVRPNAQALPAAGRAGEGRGLDRPALQAPSTRPQSRRGFPHPMDAWGPERPSVGSPEAEYHLYQLIVDIKVF